MTHHNSTPQSVLDAPSLTPVTVHEHKGFTRSERRHGLTRKHTAAEFAERKQAGRYLPFVGNVARDLLGIKRRVSKSRALGKK